MQPYVAFALPYCEMVHYEMAFPSEEVHAQLKSP